MATLTTASSTCRGGTGRPYATRHRRARLVVSETGLVAFRTREAAQADTTNADGDAVDDVLQVYDPQTGGTLSSAGRDPVPARACDPRLPYRVLDDTVTFLTSADQGRTSTRTAISGTSCSRS
jgi:hypothetical protein